MKTEAEIREALDAAANYLSNTPMASERLLFVADAIHSFLKHEKLTLDRAFGLKRGRGKYDRPVDESHLASVCEALKLHMAGKSFKTISELRGHDQKEFKRLWIRYLPLAIERFVQNKIDPQWEDIGGA